MIEIKEDKRNQRVFVEILDLSDITRRSIRRAWFALGRDLKRATNAEILRKPKSGRVYVVRGPSGRRRRHVASAPGETHANLFGSLRRSLSWKVHGTRSLEFGYGVSTTARNVMPEYGPHVELGTENMEARPSLWNGIKATQRNAEQHFEEMWRRELGR